MQFIAQVKAVRADLTKRELTLIFLVDMTDENTATAEDLAAGTGQDVALTITPRQLDMFRKNKE